MTTSEKRSRGLDYLFLLLVIGLSLFGLVMIYDTSIVLAHETFGDPRWFFKNQILWLAIGLVVMLAVSRIDYHWWQRFALHLLFMTVILLALVLVPGLSSQTLGARRRLIIPLALPFLRHINFQPSEFAKLAAVVFVAAKLGPVEPSRRGRPSKKRLRAKALTGISHLTPLLVLLGVLNGLIMLEPDLGTALMVSSLSVLVFFLGGVAIGDFALLLSLLASFALTFALGSPYRRNRLLTYLRPGADSLGISYHLNQLLIALGSGGLFGLGLGHSRQKYQYLPEPATDSIFAIVGEELGFVGTSLVLAAFLVLLWRALHIAEHAPDRFGYLLGMGLAGLIAVQAVFNLGSVTGLLPITGVPLPFISYGGSSLTVLLAGVGILLNISKVR